MALDRMPISLDAANAFVVGDHASGAVRVHGVPRGCAGGDHGRCVGSVEPQAVWAGRGLRHRRNFHDPFRLCPGFLSTSNLAISAMRSSLKRR